MKKILLSLSFALVALGASAYDFVVDGIYYNVKNSATAMLPGALEVTYKEEYDGAYTGEVTIPQTVTYNNKKYQVYRIGDKAFYNCRNLTAVNYSGIITQIGDYAFYDCVNLASWFSLAKVQSVGEYAFAGCFKLQEADLSSVQTIGQYAFFGCFGLKSFTFGENLTTVGIHSLWDAGCAEGHLYIKSSLNNFSISDCKFQYVDIEPECKCTPFLPESIKKLTFNSPLMSDWWIDRMEGLANLPSLLMTFNTSLAIDTLVIGEKASDIGGADCSFACTDKYYYKVLKFEGAPYKIGADAFKNAPISSLELPSSNIEAGAFDGCSQLSIVKIPAEGIISVENKLFPDSPISMIFDKSADGSGWPAFYGVDYSDDVEVFVTTSEAFNAYAELFENVYTVNKGAKKRFAEDVNADGNVDTQDVLKIYEHMKTYKEDDDIIIY